MNLLQLLTLTMVDRLGIDHYFIIIYGIDNICVKNFKMSARGFKPCTDITICYTICYNLFHNYLKESPSESSIKGHPCINHHKCYYHNHMSITSVITHIYTNQLLTQTTHKEGIGYEKTSES